MTYEQNVKAILESNFAGFKEEIIDIACQRICELADNPCYRALEIITAVEHHSYDTGFTEGCRYREKVICDRVLEIIDGLANKEFGTIDKEVGYDIAIDNIRDAVLALKGVEE